VVGGPPAKAIQPDSGDLTAPIAPIVSGDPNFLTDRGTLPRSASRMLQCPANYRRAAADTHLPASGLEVATPLALPNDTLT
jgi:hypothetical protein